MNWNVNSGVYPPPDDLHDGRGQKALVHTKEAVLATRVKIGRELKLEGSENWKGLTIGRE